MTTIYGSPRFLPCGDTGLSVELADGIDRQANDRVQHLFRYFRAKRFAGILDLNPTYRSLFIQYQPWKCSFENLVMLVEDGLMAPDSGQVQQAAPVRIPVCYGGVYGPDLDEVAAFHGMTVDEVVSFHSAPEYYVYMIGFTPGFPYLGGLDERLFTPRKKEPRKWVSAGSVGIADRQTGIYSIDSPGGWQLIGKTPLRLFDLNQSEPFLLNPGDFLQFVPITQNEFKCYLRHYELCSRYLSR
jgi:KipI family sensor histidine kinase inhibitor